MSLRFETYHGPDMASVLDQLAALRIAIFRDWPYLYDGDLTYERDYLARYAMDGAILVAAFDGDAMVGASTGMPLEMHGDASQLQGLSIPVAEMFYCAESVLYPRYRGKGAGHHFFDVREAYARALDRSYTAFCAIARPEDHPARPANYRPLDPFWRARGYAPLVGATAQFSWTDVGTPVESTKSLQFWINHL